MNQSKRKGCCLEVFSLIQFIIFFEAAVVSRTGKHLSVSNGRKEYFLSNGEFLSPESLSLFFFFSVTENVAIIVFTFFTKGNLVNFDLAMESIFSVRCVCMAQISSFCVCFQTFLFL